MNLLLLLMTIIALIILENTMYFMMVKLSKFKYVVTKKALTCVYQYDIVKLNLKRKEWKTMKIMINLNIFDKVVFDRSGELWCFPRTM